MSSTLSSTSSTTEARSRPSTFAPTSIRLTVARAGCGSASRRCARPRPRSGAPGPRSVSIGSRSTSVRLLRADGMLHTCTSYALPPMNRSLTSSLASRVDDCLRTSPGLRPPRRGEVQLDLNVRQVLGEVRARVDHAVDPGDRPIRVRLLAHDGQLGPEDPHDDRLAGSGQDLLMRSRR